MNIFLNNLSNTDILFVSFFFFFFFLKKNILLFLFNIRYYLFIYLFKIKDIL